MGWSIQTEWMILNMKKTLCYFINLKFKKEKWGKKLLKSFLPQRIFFFDLFPMEFIWSMVLEKPWRKENIDKKRLKEWFIIKNGYEFWEIFYQISIFEDRNQWVQYFEIIKIRPAQIFISFKIYQTSPTENLRRFKSKKSCVQFFETVQCHFS